MRRPAIFIAAWLVAAVVATAVAWQGVRIVGDQVTDDRPPSLTEADVEAALEAADTAAAEGEPEDEPEGSETTAASADPAPVSRTFDLTGGTTALRFAPDGVTVVFATPDAGYQVRSEAQDGGRAWRVEFDGPAGRSRVEGWWDGGPQYRVDDDGADGDRGEGSGGEGGGGEGGGGGSGPG